MLKKLSILDKCCYFELWFVCNVTFFMYDIKIIFRIKYINRLSNTNVFMSDNLLNTNLTADTEMTYTV